VTAREQLEEILRDKEGPRTVSLAIEALIEERITAALSHRRPDPRTRRHAPYELPRKGYMNTADLIRAREDMARHIGLCEDGILAEAGLALLDAAMDTAYEVGRSAERAAATARAMR
jgi:hypothetical protein